MTNKEAIEVMSLACSDKYVEAIDHAIKALEQMDSCPVFSDNEVKQPCLQSPCIGPKKGKWIKSSNMSKRSYQRVCNQCNHISYFCGDGNYPNCPYCLSDMREADND